jgi:hypothetical protein
VGVLRNGDGQVVTLRGDMDTLPLEKATGLPYASKVGLLTAPTEPFSAPAPYSINANPVIREL